MTDPTTNALHAELRARLLALMGTWADRATELAPDPNDPDIDPINLAMAAVFWTCTSDVREAL